MISRPRVWVHAESSEDFLQLASPPDSGCSSQVVPVPQPSPYPLGDCEQRFRRMCKGKQDSQFGSTTAWRVHIQVGKGPCSLCCLVLVFTSLVSLSVRVAAALPPMVVAAPLRAPASTADWARVQEEVHVEHPLRPETYLSVLARAGHHAVLIVDEKQFVESFVLCIDL